MRKNPWIFCKMRRSKCLNEKCHRWTTTSTTCLWLRIPCADMGASEDRSFSDSPTRKHMCSCTACSVAYSLLATPMPQVQLRQLKNGSRYPAETLVCISWIVLLLLMKCSFLFCYYYFSLRFTLSLECINITLRI